MKRSTLLLAAAVGVCAWALSVGKKRALRERALPCDIPTGPERSPSVAAEPEVTVVVPVVKEAVVQEAPKKSGLPEECYYTANGGVWHYARSCSYLKNAEDILRGSVENAEAAGKVRPCLRCATAFVKE